MNNNQSKQIFCWNCQQNHTTDSSKMPPNPYELHFVTPPCSPKRRGSPPSCDPLYPPPSPVRQVRLPSPPPTASLNTARNGWFSTGDLTELDSGCDDVRSGTNSPDKDVPSIGTIEVDVKSPFRGRSPAASPRSRALTARHRKRYVEHRRTRSIDTPKGSPKIDGASSTKVSTPAPERDRQISSSSPWSNGSKSGASPISSKEDYSADAELATLRAWKERSRKDHEATVRALETTVGRHLSEIEELKREAAGYARNAEGLRAQIEEQSRDIVKKKKEIQELEDMVVWSETTLSARVDELKANVDRKDAEIGKLKEELMEMSGLNDAKSMEIGELNTWKKVAGGDLQELNQQIMSVVTENREVKGQLVTTEERLQAKTVECKALSEKLNHETEQLVETTAKLESKEIEYSELRTKVEALVNEHEIIVAGLMEDIAKDAKTCSDKIVQLESDLSNKTEQYQKTAQEVSNYKGHLIEARNEISELCNKLHARKTEISELQKQIGENDDKYERTLAAMTANNTKEVEMYSERIAALEIEASQKNGKIRELNLQLQSKENDCANLQQQLDEKIQEYEDRIESMREQIGRLEGEAAAKDGKIEELLKDLSEMRGDVITLETNLKAVANDITESEMKVEMLNNELAACQKEVVTERQKTHTALEELAASRELCDEKQTKIEEYEADIDTLKQMNSEYSCVIESEIENNRLLAEQLEESKQHCAKQATQIVEHKTAIDKLKNDIDILQTDVESRSKKACLLMQDLTDSSEKYSASKTQVMNLENQIADHMQTIANQEADACELKRTIEMRDESIQSLEKSIEAKNNDITKLKVDLSTTEHKIIRLEALLQECKEEFKNQLMTERGSRLDATKNLESSLAEKEKEIKQYMESMKAASAEVKNMESKVVSLQLVNETLVAERDELKRWKCDVEKTVKAKDQRLNGLQSQVNDIHRDCRDLSESRSERDAVSKTSDEMLDVEALATIKVDEVTGKKTDEMKFLKEALQLKSIKIDELQKAKSLEEFKTMTKAKMNNTDGEISNLVEQNTLLSGKVDTLEKDMERQLAKFELAQQAIADLEKTLMTVDQQRKKLLKEKEMALASSHTN